MDPFRRHGIGHLSPSSLALYRAAPALWVLRYLFGIRDTETPFAWRGKAVELAVSAVLFDGASDDEAIELAMVAFEHEAQGEVSPAVSRERAGIPGMVRRAAWVFRKLGKPLAQQHRVEVWIDQIEVPIIGRLDFLYEDTVIDLKTTFAIPSKPRIDHEVQVVMYADALARRLLTIGVPAAASGRAQLLKLGVEGLPVGADARIADEAFFGMSFGHNLTANVTP
jgi:PD-(D/E)XK nuclease superfamily